MPTLKDYKLASNNAHKAGLYVGLGKGLGKDFVVSGVPDLGHYCPIYCNLPQVILSLGEKESSALKLEVQRVNIDLSDGEDDEKVSKKKEAEPEEDDDGDDDSEEKATKKTDVSEEDTEVAEEAVAESVTEDDE